MTDTTKLIISVQGKRGSGRTSLAEKVLIPAIKAAGIAAEIKEDGEKGAFLNVTVPAGHLGRLRAKPMAAITSKTLAEVAALMERRKIALLGLSEDMGPQIANWPSYVPRESALALLTEHATEELLRIDAGLADLGFRFVDEKAKA